MSSRRKIGAGSRREIGRRRHGKIGVGGRGHDKTARGKRGQGPQRPAASETHDNPAAEKRAAGRLAADGRAAGNPAPEKLAARNSATGRAVSDILAADKARALALFPVSRETEKRLDRFIDALLRWQRRLNLVAPSTLPVLWTRHVADSLQLPPLAPKARTWVDLGSGGGFPGIVIACALADEPAARVHLVESNNKKAAFLREAVRAAAIPATVHAMRAEKFGESCAESVDAVTARALAPLKTLCDQAFPFIARGAVALFPKGQDVDAELTEAAKYWRVEATKVPSKTSPEGSIVVIHGLEAR